MLERESCPRAADHVKRNGTVTRSDPGRHCVCQNVHLLHDYCYDRQPTRLGSSVMQRFSCIFCTNSVTPAIRPSRRVLMRPFGSGFALAALLGALIAPASLTAQSGAPAPADTAAKQPDSPPP